jgi:hypothetical protein
MIDVRFRPLEIPADKSRKSATFRAGWNNTLELLEKELNHLWAKDIVVQAGFELQDIRMDGWPRAGRSPKHPAVALSFRDRSGRPLSFPCDTFDDYQDNLRAVAKSLEALRAVNRYGVTKGHEQYRGFTALPPVVSQDEKSAAVSFIAKALGRTSEAVSRDLNGSYRDACRKLHPDTGGSHGEFTELQRHWAAL